MDEQFALGVVLTSKLVEDQNARVAQNGSGQSDALALAARELPTRFTDSSFVAVGHFENEFVSGRFHGSGFHILGPSAFERDGDELTSPGLFVDLGPWQFHLLALQ